MGLDRLTVRVTKGDLEEFKKSLLWADIRRELVAWKKGFEIEMRSIVDNAAKENPSTATVLMHMGDLNGRTKAVDYLLSLPDVFIQVLESEESKADKETTENLEEE